MSNFRFTFVAIIVFLLVLGGLLEFIPRHGRIVYDCRMAEISPDFPVEVRNECRKRYSGRI
jgi:hypothetical protein